SKEENSNIGGIEADPNINRPNVGGVQGQEQNAGDNIYLAKHTVPDGFKETKQFGYQHGQKVYEYKGKYYSKDADAHNGGEWKVFEEVGGKLKRIGTADNSLDIFKK
uniref:toxin C-terminal domain-containing protein n=1 Tax=Aliarcobacter cryaerophilus TaxID=28198 RepID=UPI001CA3360F